MLNSTTTPAPSRSTKRLSYEQLLDIAREETRKAQEALDQANLEYFPYSEYGQRHTVKDMDVFVARRKELFLKALYLEADLKRCQARERVLCQWIAEGRDRLKELAATPKTGTVGNGGGKPSKTFACVRGRGRAA